MSHVVSTLLEVKSLAETYMFLSVVELDTSPLPNSTPGADPGSTNLQLVLNIVFGTLGAVAFLMIVISGLRYILSSGDPGKMSQAKNGVIYSVVGLVISLAAFSIVTLVAGGLQ